MSINHLDGVYSKNKSENSIILVAEEDSNSHSHLFLERMKIEEFKRRFEPSPGLQLLPHFNIGFY